MDAVTVRALADPLRARIVQLLATERLCTCHLVELTGASQSNLSNHLRVLREAGLVQAEPVGRYTHYQVLPEPLEQLAAVWSEFAARARIGTGTRRPCG